MSEEKTRYESGAAVAELTPEQVATELLRYVPGINKEIVGRSIVAALRAAEQQGRNEEREACAEIIEKQAQTCQEAADAPNEHWEFENANAMQCRVLARIIRARSNPSTPAEE